MSLAGQAHALRPFWGISDRAFIVLDRMALNALDRPKGKQPAATYFGGWDVLAFSLGFDEPKSGAARSAVARAVRELSDQGLIKRTGEPASWGRTASYELHIGGSS